MEVTDSEANNRSIGSVWT